MKELEFWRNILTKIWERKEYDELIYGNSFVEVTYKNNMIQSIVFIAPENHHKIINKKK